MGTTESGRVFVVDDDPQVLECIKALLTAVGFEVHSFSNGFDALANLQRLSPHVVLTDVNMPQITGIELLEKLHEADRETPVILMTAYAELEMAVSAVQKGAFDFILKPFKPHHMIHSIEKALNFKRLVSIEKKYKIELEHTVLQRTRELEDALTQMRSMSRETIERLTSAAELRDEDTGKHISRIGLYAKRLSEVMKMPQDFVETIAIAATMHDVGKIGIPDSILLKCTSLTTQEFCIMKGHTEIGGRILSGSAHSVLQMAATIALTHHERWDGNGYPHGLRGEETPLAGRIVMIVDQYDALRSKRSYKPAFDHEKTIQIISRGDGRTMPEHFDPRVMEAFLGAAPDLDFIFNAERD